MALHVSGATASSVHSRMMMQNMPAGAPLSSSSITAQLVQPVALDASIFPDRTIYTTSCTGSMCPQ